MLVTQNTGLLPKTQDLKFSSLKINPDRESIGLKCWLNQVLYHSVDGFDVISGVSPGCRNAIGAEATSAHKTVQEVSCEKNSSIPFG
jgi:SUMO ligase MMS21 Smc5/6 complex component